MHRFLLTRSCGFLLQSIKQVLRDTSHIAACSIAHLKVPAEANMSSGEQGVRTPAEKRDSREYRHSLVGIHASHFASTSSCLDYFHISLFTLADAKEVACDNPGL